MENTDKMPEEATTVLPHPKALVPESLNEVNVMFMAPVENGYFKPVPDKRNTPLPAGKQAATTSQPGNGHPPALPPPSWTLELTTATPS